MNSTLCREEVLSKTRVEKEPSAKLQTVQVQRSWLYEPDASLRNVAKYGGRSLPGLQIRALMLDVFRVVQRSVLCRSRRELANAYLLAEFGFETAENEPSKVCPLSAYRSPRSSRSRRRSRTRPSPSSRRRRRCSGRPSAMFFSNFF